MSININRAYDLSGFFLISGFIFTNLPSPQGKKEVACIVFKPRVPCLCGCGESVNPPKLNIQEVQGAFCPLEPLPIFQDFCQIAPLH